MTENTEIDKITNHQDSDITALHNPPAITTTNHQIKKAGKLNNINKHNFRLALIGNPNTGKTTVFNRLCGMRAKTANFPGSTVEAKVGRCVVGKKDAAVTNIELIDLPGLYRLALNLPEAKLCRDVLDGVETIGTAPDGVVVVVDATNLVRNLWLVAELKHRGLPIIIALNMVDLAQRKGLTIDVDKLSEHLGCLVVPISARKGVGIDKLNQCMGELIAACKLEHEQGQASAGYDTQQTQTDTDISDIPATDKATVNYDSIMDWAEQVVESSIGGTTAIGEETDTFTERLDAAFTHPILGVLLFSVIMIGLFWTIFSLATIPMNLIELAFDYVGGWAGQVIPAGAIHDLVVNGVISGIAGTVVFVPQICLLFFLISLLEDTGYLARAAFVMDRIMCRFGLPGHAFVPMLSSHACAIPGILSTKLIPDRNDRLTTILIIPFMSCSARLPVYVLLTAMLFKNQPFYAGLAFFGCYALGTVVAFASAFIARRTILKGRSQAMVLELPTYKWPSLLSAVLTTWDHGFTFIKKAGTIIVAICIVLWWLNAYPASEPPELAVQYRNDAAVYEQQNKPDEAADSLQKAQLLENQNAQANSYAGKIGRFVQPVFGPLGYDWKLTVGVIASFAAREVFVSTMAVLVSGSEDIADEGVLKQIRAARRDDGKKMFDVPTSASLLVFYVLAMQCLPTLVVTRRETGKWRWAGLQLVYMSGIAYVFALITYQGLTFIIQNGT